MPLLKEKRYTSPSDVSMRLNCTIIRYKGRPFYVGDIDNMNVIGYVIKGDGNSEIVNSSDVELDVSSPPLGMTDHPRWGPVYVMRGPRRSQRQGLNPNHLLLYICAQRSMHQGAPYQTSPDRIALANAIEGEYTPLASLISAGKSGVFGRRWAVVAHPEHKKFMLLYHKTRCVGFINRRKRTINIPKGFFSKTRMMELSDATLNSGETIHVNEIAG